MTPEVAEAVEELRRAFPLNRIEVFPEEQGGAYVIVHDLFIGDRFTPSTSWCGFLIAFQYPRADIYPHFLDAGVKRADGGAFPTGITGPTPWNNRQAVQVSRRSTRWNSAQDTAATKLVKILEWLRQQ